MQAKIESLKGYSYKLSNILKRLPQTPGFITALANSLRYFNGSEQKQIHRTNKQITVIAVSANEQYIATGQRGFKGQLTTTTFIDYRKADKPLIKEFRYQKTSMHVAALSAHGRYLCTAGSSLEHVQELTILSTRSESSVETKLLHSHSFLKKEGAIVDITFSSGSEFELVVLFSNKVVLISIQLETELLKQVVAKASKVREFSNIIFNPTNQLCYACSRNGDISQINVAQSRQVRVGPRKRVIISGINFIRQVDDKHLVISGKKGFLALIQIKQLNIVVEATLHEEITSFSEIDDDKFAYIATQKASIYRLNTRTLDVQIIYCCHNSSINDICFMPSYSLAYATCAGSQIMIWKRENTKLLTKIQLTSTKNICNCIEFTSDGTFLVSGWTDDSIRIFSPVSGNQLHKFQNCHNGSKVTAIAVTRSSDKIISGGENGILRVWNINSKSFGIIYGTLLHHRRKVYSITLSEWDLNQFVTGSQDGTFAIWDLQRFEKISSGFVCNFIKEIHYRNNFEIVCVGSSPFVYIFHKNNGDIEQKIELKGSYLNSFARVSLESIFEEYFIVAGQLPYFTLFESSLEGKSTNYETYGEVTKLKLSPDRKTLVVGTINGTTLQFKLAYIYKKKET